MKLLQTADWHLGDFPGPEENGLNRRAIDTGMCINHLHDIAKIENPDIILISGDIFHQARVWADRGLKEVKHAIQVIESLAEICPVVVLRGTPNHDGAEQFEMLKAHFPAPNHLYNVHIITEPRVFLLHLQTGDIQIACLPGFDRGEFRAKFPGLSREEENQVFTNELGKIVLGLAATLDKAILSVLMSHYTVPGCNTESGQVQFLSQFEPVLLPETLDAAGFDLVALGHIHRPQQVPSCRDTFYSGAINALTFNDEGQDRGFWLHELTPDMPYDRLVRSEFVKTPARGFFTLHLGDNEIDNFNTQGLVINQDVIKDNIVRVLYSCTDEANKALNKSALEKQLYDLGAFWVSEITPEKIIIGATRDELSEKTEPESNLRAYLEAKALPDEQIVKIVDAARPIIGEAAASSTISRLMGLFVPVEIEVKNYRNYAEETFSFEDISFCVINGRNGSGKSSLFMDAILDCLYEEPREGDLTGWIRAGEDSRSGSISFTFKIGEKTFRVVRTRAKSGKATLNLSEQVEGEWVNRSDEKAKETQEKIINILGMDSLTFRSCALIMQDQYGLFLQADKESRMTILSNILGLGIYELMEDAARAKVTEFNRLISQGKTDISGLEAKIADAGDPQAEIDEWSAAADMITAKVSGMNANRDALNLKLSTMQEAAERAKRLREEIVSLEKKNEAFALQIDEQLYVVESAEKTLESEPEIAAGISEYNQLLEQEKGLINQKSRYQLKKTDLETVLADIRAANFDLDNTQALKNSAAASIADCKARLSQEQHLHEGAIDYDLTREKLTNLEALEERYRALTDDYHARQRQLDELKATYNAELATRVATLNGYRQKAELLNDCECLDIDKAECRFIADAKRSAALIDGYRTECSGWKNTELEKQTELAETIAQLDGQRGELGYDPKSVSSLRTKLQELEGLKKGYEALDGIKEQLRLHQEHQSGYEATIFKLQERINSLTHRSQDIAAEVRKCEADANKYDNLANLIEQARKWLELEKELPVAREKKNTATTQIQQLKQYMEDVSAEITAKKEAVDTEESKTTGAGLLRDELTGIEYEIELSNDELSRLQMMIGAANQRMENIKSIREMIRDSRDKLTEYGDRAAIYETLKAAFSIDGIVHNIIRSIIPTLTATANSILGQMTGGKMSMEFVTEKMLKSNSRKEVVTLDIIIEESGKATLPYLSKSGGEKVKVSLSAILALAEIKSTQAGIQLGMLFIDEPPFLDSDGIQAYCDALETIQLRYSTLKIMAITHDPTMKARFPQSIEIEKTDAGSKVVYC